MARRGHVRRPLVAGPIQTEGRFGAPPGSRYLGGSVDPLLEAGAANDVGAIPVAGVCPRLTVLVPERCDASVELTELGGEDNVVSGGQTVQESGAVLAGALDLSTDFSDRSHLAYKNG